MIKKKDIDQRYGKCLAMAIAKKGITVSRLSKDSGVSQTTLRRWISGKHAPRSFIKAAGVNDALDGMWFNLIFKQTRNGFS